MDKLSVHANDFYPKETTAKEIVSVDDSVNNTVPAMTDGKILSKVFDNEHHPGAEVNKNADNSNESIYPVPYDVLQALELLLEYMLFIENGSCSHKYTNLISEVVEGAILKITFSKKNTGSSGPLEVRASGVGCNL